MLASLAVPADLEKLRVLINSINTQHMSDVIEERHAIRKCANILCPNPEVPFQIAKKASTMKFVFQKSSIKRFGKMPYQPTDPEDPEPKKQYEVAPQALAFCSGTEADYS